MFENSTHSKLIYSHMSAGTNELISFSFCHTHVADAVWTLLINTNYIQEQHCKGNIESYILIWVPFYWCMNSVDK